MGRRSLKCFASSKQLSLGARVQRQGLELALQLDLQLDLILVAQGLVLTPAVLESGLELEQVEPESEEAVELSAEYSVELLDLMATAAQQAQKMSQ